jgi:YXWGXW repeat-containing protein
MRMITSPRIVLFMMLLFVVLAMSTTSFAQVAVGISVAFGPPALPIYDQPICPGEGYIWTPGYWAWDNDADDYYWVPGTWVLAPEVGFLWTPPWWGWSDGVFLFHEGWWGPQIGFYGGVNYGFGYFGDGFVGGRWDGDRFFYNRSVTNINVTNIHNVYNETVNVNTVNHVSYNGGPGGINRQPRPEEQRADRGRHIPPVAAQTQHFQEARRNPELRASSNHGRPPIAATGRPGDFRGSVVHAREAGGAYNPPANRGGNRGAAGNAARGQNRPAAENRAPAARGETRAPAERENRPPAARGESNASRPAAHAKDLPPMERRPPPSTGNPNRDRKYQQQQEKLYNKQNQERQKLQQKQEQEHQRMTQRNVPEPRRQQTEQRHQQQTQQLQQRHEQQQQHLQERQQPPPSKRKQ